LSLKQSTLQRLSAVAMAQAFLRLLTIARNIFLARWLAISDFGVFNLAQSFVSVSKRLESFGIETALVQRKEATSDWLRSGWVVRLFSVTIFFLLLVTCAPWLGRFFNTNLLCFVLLLLAFILPIGLLGFMGRILLTRQLEFRKLSLFNFVGSFFVIAMTVCLPRKGWGVWSLVWGALASALLDSILYFSWQRKNKISILGSISWNQAKELMRFGRPLLGAATVSFLVVHLDDLIVGKLLGTASLGLYTIAFSWANFAVTGFVNVVGKVIFPTVASIQGELHRVRRGYLEAVRLTTMVVAPLCLGLFAVAPSFIETILGTRWLEAAPAMRVLCLYALIRGIGGVGGSVRKGLGRPDIFFKLGLLFLAVMLLTIFPFTLKWGITGTAFSVLLAALVSNAAVYFYNSSLLQLKRGAVLLNLAQPLLFASTTAVVMVFLSLIFSFFWVVLVGATLYSCLLMAFCRQELVELCNKWFTAKEPLTKVDEKNGELA